MRKAAPFKPEDAQISWVPAAPIAGRRARVSRHARRAATSSRATCRRAPTPGAAAGVVDLASLNLINAALAVGRGDAGRRLAGRPRRARLRDAGDRPRQGADLLPHAAARDGRGPGGPRPPDGDVPRGPARRRHASRAWCCRARRRAAPRPASGCAAGSRSGWASKVETLDFRGTAAMRDRISAGAELLDALAPAVGVVLREQVA